jgi:hypothetical protein
LAVVDQPRTGLGERCNGRNLRSARTECGQCPWFIVVLYEPYKPLLIIVVGQQV